MAWTEDRVEILKKLWLEGHSASQIAAELGSVTRNAVIGKVHRLGLSGRGKPTSTATPKPRKPRATPARRTTTTTRPGSGGVPRSVGATALKTDAIADVALEVEQEIIPLEVLDGAGPRLSLLELTETTCKWPVGDPGDADFHFCGRESDAAVPYCKHHAAAAYQPSQERRRRAAAGN